MLRFERSGGGLVSGLSAYLESIKKVGDPVAATDYIWVGWPGMTIADREKDKLKADLLSRLQAYPVFISERDMEAFYLGFCNRTIWPLFHYFPERVIVDQDYWKSYVRVNESFRKAVLEIIRPGDVVWIHDYHLLLLPKLLKESLADVPIGFFLHIPFPSFEMFRLLPRKWSREILEGLLGANLIGFHTYDYTQHFLGCVLRILGHEHNMGKLLLDNRIAKADTFPMGIDFTDYYDTALSQEVEKETRLIRKTLGERKVVLSIDRLDYTKGVVHRLRGYEAFLRANPQWHGKVVLALVVVPSRTGVEHYQQMKRQIDGLVGKINGAFGNLHWNPIVYQYNFLSKVPLVALYRAANVALVTPLRDGMNLIAKEYVASRTDQSGVLVLSDMAGASKELGEAIMVNPVNEEEIVEALKEALEMAPEEQARRITAMQKRLRRYDVARWAGEFTHDLSALQREQQQWDEKSRDPFVREALLRRCHSAQRRLIFLDYDGTLVQFENDPKAASPGGSLLSILERLSQNPRNQVVLISGRERATLQKWFATVPMALVAEHGVWIKENRESEWNLTRPVTSDWKPRIFPILERYVDRLPGSWIEEKDFSLVWHYRKTDREQGAIVARELSDELVALTAAVDVQVLHGAKIVEIRQDSVNKGTAGRYFVERTEPDFILAIGDDWTDEDLFRALPESACTIKVGMAQTHAQYNLANQSEVVNLLEALAV